MMLCMPCCAGKGGSPLSARARLSAKGARPASPGRCSRLLENFTIGLIISDALSFRLTQMVAGSSARPHQAASDTISCVSLHAKLPAVHLP